MTSIYSTGTVSVTNDDAVVTGSGTAWAVALVTGGSFSCAGLSIPIVSVDSDTSLTLAYPWPGATAAGAAYAIQRDNSDAANVVDLYDKMSRVLQQLGLAGIHPDADGTIVDRDALTLGTSDKGFIFLYAEPGFDLAFYRWSGTAWQGPFAVKGDVGPQGNAGIGSGGLGLPTPGAANKLAYYTGPNALALTDLTALARTLLASTSLAGMQAAVGVREVLTAARTYYVRADGNDGNTGLANTSGGAFLTIQKAIDACYTIDMAGFAVTIQVGPGTYTGAINVSAPFLGGSVLLLGDATTPSNVLISHSVVNSFWVANPGTVLSISGFKIIDSTAASLGRGIRVTAGATVNIAGNMDFGSCTRAHIEIETGALVQVLANYSITGAASYHWLISGGASLSLSGRTITITGTPAFSNGFIDASVLAIATVFNATFTGSATGKRYNSTLNSVINTFGGGASYFPGNVAGTATTGQYA